MYSMSSLEQATAEETITISRAFFSHLLNCLANQKFIHEMNTENLKSVQFENQAYIDHAYHQGMEMLINGKMEFTYRPPSLDVHAVKETYETVSADLPTRR